MTDIIVLDNPVRRDFCIAAFEGLINIGLRPTYMVGTLDDLPNDGIGKIVVTWNYWQGDIIKNKGYDLLVMELGYVGNRYEFSSLGWNGLNNYAKFYDYSEDAGERFLSHGGKLKDWSINYDGYALILGQLPGDSSLKGLDMNPIYLSWIKNITLINEKVIFRHHPESIRIGKTWNIPNEYVSKNDLSTDLSGAKYTICFNSNSSVDSILDGIPCVAMDFGTMFYDLCGKNLGEIITPNREAAAYRLAWRQFSIEEIREGWPLKNLLSMPNRKL